ncbi:MAG: NAD(P)H-binding protein, partial [Acidimicrobiales bacterium]|nr:NAD(P)H-binding protein [Acidimicrobiales bacterium]
MRIAIIGGHGKVALLAAPLLVADGHEVTGVIRDPGQADEVAAAGATPVVADMEALDAAALGEVLHGHEAVVWAAGAGGGDPSRTYAVDRDAAIRSMEAAARAGIDRYVMVSYFGAGPEHGVPEDSSFFPYAEAKAAADEHLRGTELAWTILGPSRLTDDPGTGGIEVG